MTIVLWVLLARPFRAYVCARFLIPRALPWAVIDRPLGAKQRATSLLPRPIRGLFWLLNGGTGTLACVLCMGGISLGTQARVPVPPAQFIIAHP